MPATAKKPAAPTQADLDIIRGSLVRTAMACFTDDDGQPIVAFPHQRLIAFALERDYLEHTTIVAPPGFAKTWWVDFSLAHRIAHNLSLRVMYISASTAHALKQSSMIRNTIDSNPVFNLLFPNAKLGAKRGEFAWQVERPSRNDPNPTFIAVGMDGTILGSRVDLLVTDDINTEIQQMSALQRDKVRSVASNTVMTRLRPNKKGRAINIQTRWHEEDFAAWTIENQWSYLHFRALSENDEPEQWADFTVYTERKRDLLAVDLLKDGWRYEIAEMGDKEKGDQRWQFNIFLHANGPSLWPERFPSEELITLRSHRPARMWACTFLGLPSPEGGEIISVDKFQPYDWVAGEHKRVQFLQIVQAWDTAFSTKTTADFSVCATIGLARDGRMWLLDILRKRMDFPSLKQAVRNQFIAWRPNAIIVEDEASGQSLLQEIRKSDDFSEGSLPIIAVKPGRDKVSRTNAITGYIDGERVYVPQNAPWSQDFIRECSIFPNGSHDDQVDAFVYAIQRLVVRGIQEEKDEDYFGTETYLGDVRSKSF